MIHFSKRTFSWIRIYSSFKWCTCFHPPPNFYWVMLFFSGSHNGWTSLNIRTNSHIFLHYSNPLMCNEFPDCLRWSLVNLLTMTICSRYPVVATTERIISKESGDYFRITSMHCYYTLNKNTHTTLIILLIYSSI